MGKMCINKKYTLSKVIQLKHESGCRARGLDHHSMSHGERQGHGPWRRLSTIPEKPLKNDMTWVS